MNIEGSISSPTAPETRMPVLVAEDDLTARTILAGVLKKWGYDPVTVHDGQEAWNALQEPGCPSLVIMDWMMPGIDGLEVIRRVRSTLTEQSPYIILLTSRDEKSDIYLGLETGANDYICKPFDNEELWARIRVGQRTVELQNNLLETRQNLAHLAAHDPLTGIFNRRAILDQLSKELARSRRELSGSSPPGALCVGFFDIDHFKQINDRFGHAAGDMVLCAIGDTLKSHLRKYDSFGRLGGDEFLIVAPSMDEPNFKSLFERLCTAIAEMTLKTSAGDITLTISMGVAVALPNSDGEQLLNQADEAMYRAKKEGGSRVIFT